MYLVFVYELILTCCIKVLIVVHCHAWEDSHAVGQGWGQARGSIPVRTTNFLRCQVFHVWEEELPCFIEYSALKYSGSIFKKDLGPGHLKVVHVGHGEVRHVQVGHIGNILIYSI